jgi:CRP/FNR family transcriptional regulator, cyclic AMP receptor protein
LSLRNIDLFSGLNDHQLDVLQAGARLRHYTRGSVIVTEGDDAHALFIVGKGTLKAYLSGNDGKEVILSTLGPGDYFGELALIDNEPRSAMVATLEPSELLQISKDVFRQLMLQDPQAMLAVSCSLVARIRHLTDSVRTLALVDVFGRVSRLLEELGSRDAEGHLVIEPKPTQVEIASRVGSSREMVSRIFKDLAIGGYIQIEPDCIRVCKPLPTRW